MPATAMNHFTILTDDVPGTVAFYRDLLGLTDGARPPLEFPGAWLYAGGSPILHVVGGRTAGELKAGVIDHMAFSATDLSDTLALLTSRNIEHVCRRQRRSGMWQVFFHDPNGARVELDFARRRAPARGRSRYRMISRHRAPPELAVDHLIVGAVSLQAGIEWMESRARRACADGRPPCRHGHPQRALRTRPAPFSRGHRDRSRRRRTGRGRAGSISTSRGCARACRSAGTDPLGRAHTAIWRRMRRGARSTSARSRQCNGATSPGA